MGGGLPPIAVVQLKILSLTHGNRGQAPSHFDHLEPLGPLEPGLPDLVPNPEHAAP